MNIATTIIDSGAADDSSSVVLATIEKVIGISSIVGVDRCECARVLGWDVLVGKGTLKEGDYGVLFAYDSIVDAGNPHLAFMAARNYRVKVQAFFKGTFTSAALFMPLSVLEPYVSSVDVDKNVLLLKDGTEMPFDEGTDITSLTNTTKYQSSNSKFKNKGGKTYLGNMEARGDFPSWLRKTDETHAQKFSWENLKKIAEGVPLYGTIKQDGSSGTFAWDGSDEPDGFHVLSRNLDLKKWLDGDVQIIKIYDENNNLVEEKSVEKQANAFWKCALRYDIENVLRSYAPRRLAIQGEVVGPSIQSNRTGDSSIDFYVFDVWDIDNQTYFEYADLKAFCEKNGLKMVEVLYENIYLDKLNDVQDLLEMSKGVYPLNPTQAREGIVWRSMVNPNNAYSRLNRRISFKTINPQFFD